MLSAQRDESAFSWVDHAGRKTGRYMTMGRFPVLTGERGQAGEVRRQKHKEGWMSEVRHGNDLGFHPEIMGLCLKTLEKRNVMVRF